MAHDRLLWDGHRGYLRRGDVLVRLRRPPVLPELPAYEALAFAPPRVAAVAPAGAPSRGLSAPEQSGIVQLLERISAAVDDVLDGNSTLVVVMP